MINETVQVPLETLKDMQRLLKDIVESDTAKKFKASENLKIYCPRLNKEKVDTVRKKINLLLE